MENPFKNPVANEELDMGWQFFAPENQAHLDSVIDTLKVAPEFRNFYRNRMLRLWVKAGSEAFKAGVWRNGEGS